MQWPYISAQQVPNANKTVALKTVTFANSWPELYLNRIVLLEEKFKVLTSIHLDNLISCLLAKGM